MGKYVLNNLISNFSTLFRLSISFSNKPYRLVIKIKFTDSLRSVFSALRWFCVQRFFSERNYVQFSLHVKKNKFSAVSYQN